MFITMYVLKDLVLKHLLCMNCFILIGSKNYYSLELMGGNARDRYRVLNFAIFSINFILHAIEKSKKKKNKFHKSLEP